MAVPKKRTSVSRKGLRRAGQHHKLYGKTSVLTDGTTGELTLKGCISPSGYWKGKKVFNTRADKAENTEE